MTSLKPGKSYMTKGDAMKVIVTSFCSTVAPSEFIVSFPGSSAIVHNEYLCSFVLHSIITELLPSLVHQLRVSAAR